MPPDELAGYSATATPAHSFDPDTLVELGRMMISMHPKDSDSNIAAAYVYLGQFIAHDLTMLSTGELTASTSHQRPMADLRNNRTLTFDLDSVYGSGWGDAAIATLPGGAMKLSTTQGNAAFVGDDDLPRNKDLLAVIPDPRNDENLLIAQLHVQFLKLHNLIISKIPLGTDQEKFEQARAEVTLLYQEIVLYDFLYTLCDNTIVDAVRADARLNIFNIVSPLDKMPIEFAMAGFRFGHSMVLDQYKISRRTTNVHLDELFRLTGRATPPLDSHVKLPAEVVVDWSMMLNDVDLKAARIDAKIFAKPAPVPENQRSNLATRNLLRSNGKLASAQGFIDWLAVKRIQCPGLVKLKPEEFRALKYFTNTDMADNLKQHSPLWYYILEEADARMNGRKLGALGSLIVASTIVNILKSMPRSISTGNAGTRFVSNEAEKFSLAKLFSLTQPNFKK